MRLLTRVLLVPFFLLLAPAAFAQYDGVDNKEGLGDGCASTMSPDDCMFGDSGWNDITQCTRAACPACAFDSTGTKSICYYLPGNFGYCTCAGRPSVAVDSQGNKVPNCQTTGSCVSHR
jgi:hypothetical protein